jgi:ABC-type nitrate/sulfonate/bicarbonate transport system substrate-binding protein
VEAHEQRNDNMKKMIVCIALAFVLFTWASSSNAEKLRVAYPTLGPGSTPSWVALEAGFWKKNGLDVELILLGGGARMLPALISGSVDVILGSDTGVTLANLQGANLVRIGVTMNSLGYSLVTQPAIRSIQDLKGKVLGIGRGRDASYARLIKILSDHGLHPATDVKFLPVGETPSGRLQAIKNGLVQGAVFTPPLDLVGRRDGLRILQKIDVPTLGGGITTTAGIVQQNRKSLLAFLRAYMEGIQYMANHKQETLKVFFKYFRNPDGEALAYLYDDTVPRIAKGLRPNPESVRSILDQIAIDDPRAKQLTETDHWNLTLLDEIQQSRSVDKLDKK